MLKAPTFNGNDLPCFILLTAGTGKIHQNNFDTPIITDLYKEFQPLTFSNFKNRRPKVYFTVFPNPAGMGERVKYAFFFCP
jgi:hypothetical protein